MPRKSEQTLADWTGRASDSEDARYEWTRTNFWGAAVKPAVLVRLAIAAAAGCWLLIALVLGVSVDEHLLLKTLGGVIMAVVLLYTLFDLWLWRLLPVAASKRPKVWGTWKADMESHWTHPATGEKKVTHKTIYLVVTQTFSSVKVTGRMDISDSWTLSADIEPRDDGGFQLAYTYRNEAHVAHRAHNAPHRGSVVLGISTTPKTTLEGDYWTDRLTTGRIKAIGRSKKRYSSFEAAEGGDYSI